MLENFAAMIGELLSIYAGMGARVPGTITTYTTFLGEMTLKKTFSFGAEQEGYQKLTDTVELTISRVSSSTGKIAANVLSFTNMFNGVQEQITSLLANFAPQAVFEQPPTEVLT